MSSKEQYRHTLKQEKAIILKFVNENKALKAENEALKGKLNRALKELKITGEMLEIALASKRRWWQFWK